MLLLLINVGVVNCQVEFLEKLIIKIVNFVRRQRTGN